MPTIMQTSTRLKRQILPSVLLTVLKFRFSRVRKYFCMRPTVLNWPAIRLTVSSSWLVCSGGEPCFCGMFADRTSFSTAISRSTSLSALKEVEEEGFCRQKVYSPGDCAVKTKSPCRWAVSLSIFLELGPVTVTSMSKEPPD